MQTLALILIPFAAALLVFTLNHKLGRMVSLIAAGAELILSLNVLMQFQRNDSMQFGFSKVWIDSIGLNFSIGLDGISLLLILLTTTLTPFIILSTFNKQQQNPASFYGLILLMQSALIGVFTAQDGLLFYLFWEMALIPIYFICLMWGGENRSRITFKFFLYTLAGSLLMLVAIIYLYYATPGSHTFEIDALYAAGQALTPVEQSWIFWALFVAFAIKMPVFPFHTWQPDTYTVAPVEGTMLLSGIMLKMGLYGLIRWILPVVPAGVQEWGFTAVILSVIGIIYASCLAIVQKDYKRLIAYSSIAHVGLISAGILTLQNTGVQGAMIQMLSHGILAFGLFYCVEIISSRTNTRVLADLGGIRNIAPVFSTVFIILTLGSISLPLTSGFTGEFLLLNSLFQYQWILGSLAGLTIILGAVYMLRSYQQSVLGDVKVITGAFADLNLNEKLVIFPIAALVLIMGVFPTPFLEISEASVQKIVTIYSNYGVAIK
jgi:NADH-quinone oxidoreductase subunit M